MQFLRRNARIVKVSHNSDTSCFPPSTYLDAGRRQHIIVACSQLARLPRLRAVALPFVANISAWMHCVLFIVTEIMHAPRIWMYTQLVNYDVIRAFG